MTVTILSNKCQNQTQIWFNKNFSEFLFNMKIQSIHFHILSQFATLAWNHNDMVEIGVVICSNLVGLSWCRRWLIMEINSKFFLNVCHFFSALYEGYGEVHCNSLPWCQTCNVITNPSVSHRMTSAKCPIMVSFKL